MAGKGRGCDKRLFALWDRYQSHERSADAVLIEVVEEHLARGQNEAAQGVASYFLLRDSEPAVRSRRCLVLGEALERRGRSDAAVEYYLQGLRLEPTDDEVCYLLNRNLGRSLNHLGRFAEAEPFCRVAIRCDPLRHCAHEHLGVALEGQGQHLEAARAFITAIRARPCEPMALRRLQSLAKRHRTSVAIGIPEIATVVRQYREMVYAARVMRAAG